MSRNILTSPGKKCTSPEGVRIVESVKIVRSVRIVVTDQTDQMNQTDRHICRALEGDIDTTMHPFRSIADTCGISEREVLQRIRRMKEAGFIRRFGAVLRHRKAGVTENALVLWAAPSGQSERVGALLASHDEVTHCYERRPAFGGKYTLFSMIQCRKGPVEAFVRTLAPTLGIDDYLILDSMEEFKKQSMEYFGNE